MTDDRIKELLDATVAYLGDNYNETDQIRILTEIGFSQDELIENYNFSESDFENEDDLIPLF